LFEDAETYFKRKTDYQQRLQNLSKKNYGQIQSRVNTNLVPASGSVSMNQEQPYEPQPNAELPYNVGNQAIPEE